MYRKKLLALGIPADILGFEALNCALELYKPMQSLTMLYHVIAEKFNMTWQQVERNMRHAISKTEEEITVGQFIAKYKILWEEK